MNECKKHSFIIEWFDSEHTECPVCLFQSELEKSTPECRASCEVFIDWEKAEADNAGLVMELENKQLTLEIFKTERDLHKEKSRQLQAEIEQLKRAHTELTYQCEEAIDHNQWNRIQIGLDNANELLPRQ